MEDNEEQQNEVQVIVPQLPRIGLDNLLIEEDIDYRLLNFFAVQIFEDLPRCDKNHAVCPVDLFASFAMLLIGSNGDTLIDLQRFLGCSLFSPPVSDDRALKTIQTVLQVFAYERFKLRPNYDLFNVIRLLVDERAKYTDSYKVLIKRHFNVDIDKINFETDSDVISDQINELIQMELNDQIQTFHTKIDKQTQLIIMSAVRFKGKWEIQFPLDDISDEYFYNDIDRRTTVKMMALRNRCFKYTHSLKWDSQVVEIPFAAESMSFIMIVPKTKNGLDKLLEGLDFDSLTKAIDELYSRRCDVFLPKFKLDCDYDFAKLYNKSKVFNTDSELSKIGGKHRIKVNNILHKVVFEINDNGVNPLKSDLKDPIPLRVRADHPFLFIVKDNRTEAWVFVGKVHSL